MKNDASIQIEKYLLGELGEAEAREVEQRTETDAVFARELQLQREILKGIDLFGDERMRAKLTGLDQALAQKGFFDPEQTARQANGYGFWPSVRRNRWAAAAALLLLLTGAGWWWRTQLSPAANAPEVNSESVPSAPAPEIQPGASPALPGDRPDQTGSKTAQYQPRQVDDHYVALARSAWTIPDFSQFRGTRGSKPTLLAAATEAFQKNDFHLVIRLLEPVTAADSNYWPCAEIYAHASFLSGKTEQAADRFRRIAASGQLPFSERAEWFLLLSRLANFPQGKAEYEVLLKKILADEGHPYFDQAQKIAAKVKAGDR